MIRALLTLHSPEIVDTYGGQRTVCGHCSTGDPYCTVSDDWPCPTVAIIDLFLKALKAREDEV